MNMILTKIMKICCIKLRNMENMEIYMMVIIWVVIQEKKKENDYSIIDIIGNNRIEGYEKYIIECFKYISPNDTDKGLGKYSTKINTILGIISGDIKMID